MTYIILHAGFPPLALHIIVLPFQHVSRLRNSLMQKTQLTEDETGIQWVAGPCAYIYDIEALIDEISHGRQLFEDELWSARSIG